MNKGEYIIDVPLDEVTLRGTCLGEMDGQVYFKSDDGRYAMVNSKDVTQTDEWRIRLDEQLDIRPSMHFISKKEREIIKTLENCDEGATQ